MGSCRRSQGAVQGRGPIIRRAGCSEAWHRTCFGSTRSWVRIPPPRPLARDRRGPRPVLRDANKEAGSNRGHEERRRQEKSKAVVFSLVWFEQGVRPFEVSFGGCS
jgi:hypothetical protein